LHRYLGHAKESAELIDVIADRMKMDTETRKALKFAAANHMKLHDLLKMKDSTIVKLIDDPNWDILQAVAEADAKARGNMFNEAEWKAIIYKVDKLRNKYKGSTVEDTIKKIVNGKLLAKLRPDLKPGPIYGEILNKTIQWILDNNIDLEDTKTIFNYIKVL
jgi:hypothetical protein